MQLSLKAGISTRFVFAFAAVIFVNFAANVVAYNRLGLIRSNYELSRDSYETMLGLQSLLGTIVAQYGALDRFLASGELSSLKPFRTTGKQAFDIDLQKLAAQRPADQEHQERLNSINRYLNEWRSAAERHIHDPITNKREEAQAKLEYLLKEVDSIFELERSRNATRAQGQSAALDVASVVSIAGPAAALLTGLLVSVLLMRAISLPIRHLTAAMEKVADNKLDTPIPATQRSDEIGAMARTLQIFRDGLAERQRLRDKAEAEQSDRSLRQEKLGSAISLFDDTVQQLLNIVNTRIDQMRTVSETLAQVAGETTSRAANALTSSHQASGNITQVSSSAEELASSISSIARRIIALNDAATKATQTTAATNTQVAVLSAASKKIGDVIAMINNIAEQTNLLALNATIEASRAGEAGKGFGVVAIEVKSLAYQTAQATTEIVQQVNAIQDSTFRTVDAIQQMTQMLSDINSVTAEISSAITEQEITTTAISRSMQEASAGTAEMERDLSMVSEAASRTSKAAIDTETASLDVSRRATELRIVINGFLKEVTD